MNIQGLFFFFFRIDWFDLLVVHGTLQVSSLAPQFKTSIFQLSAFFKVQLSHSHMTTGKTIALTIWTLVGKLMSLLFNMPSRFVIAFLPRSKHLLILCIQSLSTVILEPKKIKSVTVSTFSTSICHEVMGLGAMIFNFWMLSFKPAFLPSSFTPIKRLFSSLLPAIRVLSSGYLRLLIFLLAILISACDSSTLAFHRIYSAEKLNKQSDNLQLWCTPLPPVYCSMSSSNCCFLSCIQASQEAGKVVWYSHVFRTI